MGDLDARALAALYGEGAPRAWVLLMAALTVLGSGFGAALLVPALALPRTRRVASYLAAVVAGQATLVFTLKQLIGRPRPCTSIAGVHALVFAAPTDPSCPSGHAAGAFSVATFCAVVLLVRAREGAGLALGAARAAALGLYVLAFGIALSRPVLGVHFPVDVTLGALLGAAVGGLGARVYLRRAGAAA